MSGFMTGFGNAFTRSFESSRNRRLDREDEVFKFKMDTFLQEQEKRKAKKAKLDEWESQAKTMAQDLGKPEAAGFLFDRFSTYGPEKTMRLIEQGRLKFDQNKAKPQESQGLGSELITQTQEAMGPEVAPVQTLNSPKSLDRVDKRLMEVTDGLYGQVQEPVKSDLMDSSSSGFFFDLTPEQEVSAGNLSDAIYSYTLAKQNNDEAAAKSAQMKIDALTLSASIQAEQQAKSKGIQTQRIKIPNEAGGFTVSHVPIVQEGGETVAKVRGQNLILSQGQFDFMSDEEFDARAKLHEVLGKRSQVYNTKATGMIEALDSSGRMLELVNSDPAILTASAGLFESFTRGTREIIEGANLITEELRRTKDMTPQELSEFAEKASERQKQLNYIISEEGQEIGVKKAAFNSLLQLSAYKFAAINGQDGRAASDQDIERFLEIAGRANTQEKFEEAIRNTFGVSLVGLSNDSYLLSQSPELSNFEKMYGYKPDWVPASVEELIENTDENSYARSGLQFLLNSDFSNTQREAPQSNNNFQVEPEDIEILRSNPTPETIRAFEEVFGRGSAQQYLQQNGEIPNDG